MALRFTGKVGVLASEEEDRPVSGIVIASVVVLVVVDAGTGSAASAVNIPSCMHLHERMIAVLVTLVLAGLSLTDDC